MFFFFSVKSYHSIYYCSETYTKHELIAMAHHAIETSIYSIPITGSNMFWKHTRMNAVRYQLFVGPCQANVHRSANETILKSAIFPPKVCHTITIQTTMQALLEVLTHTHIYILMQHIPVMLLLTLIKIVWLRFWLAYTRTHIHIYIY